MSWWRTEVNRLREENEAVKNLASALHERLWEVETERASQGFDNWLDEFRGEFYDGFSDGYRNGYRDGRADEAGGR